MKLTKEEGREIVWDKAEHFETVEDTITDTTRWSVVHDIVFRDKRDGRLYRMDYSVGATEHQDERPFEYSDPEPVEVRAVEKVVTVYEPVVRDAAPEASKSA